MRAVVGSSDVPCLVLLGSFFGTIVGLVWFCFEDPESFVDADEPWEFVGSFAFPSLVPGVEALSSAGVGLEELDSPCCFFVADLLACPVPFLSDCRVFVIDRELFLHDLVHVFIASGFCVEGGSE